MKKQIITILLAALALALNAAVAQQSPQTTTKKSTAATTKKTATKPSASLLNPASLKDQAPPYFNAKFSTTKGDFVMEVRRAWAPQGADRFYNLVKYHFYDGAAFFRVLPGFVVQFGISSQPQISQAWERAVIPDDPPSQGNTRGMVTFATAGANTRTTQVFINLGDNSTLDHMGFTPFGKITSGMDVVDQLFAGYGEGAPNGSGPSQDRMQKEGKTYLESISRSWIRSRPRK